MTFESICCPMAQMFTSDLKGFCHEKWPFLGKNNNFSAFPFNFLLQPLTQPQIIDCFERIKILKLVALS